MMIRVVVLLLAASGFVGLVTPTSYAETGAECSTRTTLRYVATACEQVSRIGESRRTRKGNEGQKAKPLCVAMAAGRCDRGLACTVSGVEGAYYAIFKDGGKVAGSACLTPDDPRRPTPERALTADVVAQAMQRLRWTTPTLTVQPPGGRTLVNLPTNVYADARTQTLTATLLTQTVTIEVTPASYTWDFGDGTTLTTRKPGRPYPDLDITHPYPRVGTYPLRLTTTLTGRYRTPTTPWQDIPGTLRRTTAPQPLRVVEASPQLRGY